VKWEVISWRCRRRVGAPIPAVAGGLLVLLIKLPCFSFGQSCRDGAVHKNTVGVLASHMNSKREVSKGSRTRRRRDGKKVGNIIEIELRNHIVLEYRKPPSQWNNT
jgi:hypothetical protein